MSPGTCKPVGIIETMRAVHFSRTLKACAAASVMAAGVAIHAQAPATPAAPPAGGAKPPAAQTPETPSQGGVIRRTFDMITTDVIVRDNTGQFIADLKKDDFDVMEDGVKQELVSFVLTHGGRVYNASAPPPAPQMEGIILPAAKPTSDAAGRIWLIFVDDLHLDFSNTGRIKDLFKKISKELVHEGDLFGIVSSGPSSIAIDMTYDRKRLDEAIEKISGAGLEAVGDPRHAARGGRAGRSPLSRARRIRHRLRHPEEPGVGAQPAQGVRLREQRLRLQSVLRDAASRTTRS